MTSIGSSIIDYFKKVGKTKDNSSRAPYVYEIPKAIAPFIPEVIKPAEVAPVPTPVTTSNKGLLAPVEVAISKATSKTPVETSGLTAKQQTARTSATYYTTPGAGNPALGSAEYVRQQELSKKIGALVANPSRRDIPADTVYNFLTGKISFEEAESIITGSPVFNPNIGPQIDFGQGKVPYKEGMTQAPAEMPVVPKEKPVEITPNLEIGGVTPPTLSTPTAPSAVQTNFNSIAVDTEKNKQALTDAYNAEIAKIDAQKVTAQAKIDELTTKQEGVLGDINTATAPFRAALETSERDRLKVEENFFANQQLTNELDSLLSEGNALIKQQRETTGLATIRDPRVNQTISDVNARAGVIEAVMNARNNQITVAENLIDRTTAAITADRNDQLSYYSTLYNFYENTKTAEGNKLITLTASEKEYIDNKIEMIKTDLANSQATAENIKAAMINPATALIYAQAGISLNDTITTINQKLANYTYTKEVSDTSNTMTTNGYQYLLPEQAAKLSSEAYTPITDSKGVVSYWKKPTAAPGEAAKTVKVGEVEYQWNPETNRYDIPVGAEITPSAIKTDASQKTVDTIINLLDPNTPTGTGLAGAVGPTALARSAWWNPMSAFGWKNISGATQDFIASVEQIVKQMTLENLIAAKKGGATFGALSNMELSLIADSATKIGTWRIIDKNGKTVGYKASEKSFKTELKTIQDFVQKSIDLSKNTSTTTGDEVTNLEYNSDGTLKAVEF